MSEPLNLDGSAALEEWIIQYSLSIETAALFLGVSRRTVQRWRTGRKVPRRVALHIDAWNNGTLLRCGLNRTTLKWACRDNTVRDWACPGWRNS